MRRLAIAALALLFACGGGGTEPVNVLGGTYSLRTYNGGGLPAYVDPALGSCGSMIVSGSVSGGNNARVSFSRSYSTPCSAGNPITTSARAGTIAVAGTLVTVTLDADQSNPSQTYTGTLTSSDLTLNYTANLGARQLVQSFAFVRQ